MKSSDSREIFFPFGYIVGLDEYQFQSSFVPDEKIESLYPRRQLRPQTVQPVKYLVRPQHVRFRSSSYDDHMMDR